jgi:hypothetical protein
MPARLNSISDKANTLQTLIFASFLSLSLASSLSLSPPFDVRVETLIDPILIDNPKPRFSWSTSSLQVQSGYRIWVFQGSTLQWDSGIVDSNRSNEIIYNNNAHKLLSDTDYSVIVSARYSPGGWLNATKKAFFSVGLLSQSDWDGAEWIGGKNQLRSNEFSLPTSDPITRARVYLTGVGFVELWVNGQRVSSDAQGRETFINPGFSTVFSRRVLYNAYDVASLLFPGGKNVVGIRLGMGKYGYLGEFCTNGPDKCNSAILRLTVEQSNGSGRSTTALISSSSSGWIATTSSILFDHLYNGEIVDGRIESQQNGWSSPSFVPGTEWIPVENHSPQTAELSAHVMPQITAWESEPRIPINVTSAPASGPSSFVFDLGINVVGICTLSIPGPTVSGANVTLILAETLLSNGNVHVQFHCPSSCCADGGNCANQTFTYLTKGVAAGQVETYRPTFSYSGFRWAQVFGWPAAPAPPPTIDALSCISTSTGVDTAGTINFNGSIPEGRILNGIQSLVIRSQRANLHSHPTDCPQREKRGWMADASVSADEASLNLDMQVVYENWIRTHQDTSDVGCGPLPPNATCPKWHPDQPNDVSINPYEMIESMGSSSSISALPIPNCYICCSGRPGFGCVKDTPFNTTGSIADVIPFDKNGYGSFPGSISWMSANFVVMNVLKDRYNSLQTLNSVFPALKAHLLFYNWNSWKNNNVTGLVYWDQYGDWNSLVATNGLLIANFYYLFDSLEMSDLAAQLGNPDDALAFLGLSAYLNAEIPQAYATFQPGKDAFWDKGSQAAQACGIFLGIGGDIYQNLTAGSLSVLVADVIARDYHYTVGTIGSRFLLQSLSMSGRGDIALKLASQTSYPSIGAMFEGTAEQPPLGTLWESWVGPATDGSSGNHIMLGGGIGEWFYSYALGLRFSFKRTSPMYTPSEQICSRKVGFGINLQSLKGVSGSDMCIIASVLETIKERRALGESAGSLIEYSSLLSMVKAERLVQNAPSAPSPVNIIPSARLVIDASIANVLKSINGSISTPYGPLSASWSFPSIGNLNIKMIIPSGVVTDVFIPLHLLAKGTQHKIALKHDKINWSSSLFCQSQNDSKVLIEAINACKVTNEMGAKSIENELWTWARKSVPNHRVDKGEAETWEEQYLSFHIGGGEWNLDLSSTL